MTKTELTALAMEADPRTPYVVLQAIAGMDAAERIAAAKCYAAIVGERQLPANIGRTEKRPVVRTVKRHDARRRIEDLRHAARL